IGGGDVPVAAVADAAAAASQLGLSHRRPADDDRVLRARARPANLRVQAWREAARLECRYSTHVKMRARLGQSMSMPSRSEESAPIP
ncbi:MAG: hypothetical protein ACPG20_05395, partial [Pontimonas sp.]